MGNNQFGSGLMLVGVQVRIALTARPQLRPEAPAACAAGEELCARGGQHHRLGLFHRPVGAHRQQVGHRRGRAHQGAWAPRAPPLPAQHTLVYSVLYFTPAFIVVSHRLVACATCVCDLFQYPGLPRVPPQLAAGLPHMPCTMLQMLHATCVSAGEVAARDVKRARPQLQPCD